MEDSATGHTGDIRGPQLALLAYVVVFAAKLGAYIASGVLALYAEALHTLSDIFISAFLLVATLTSFELYREAIPRLFAPQPPAYESLPLALAVILGSMALAAVPLWKLLAQRARGAAAKAQLVELVPQTVHAGMRIAVPPDLSVAQAARIAAKVERRVHAGAHPGHCSVQTEPASS